MMLVVNVLLFWSLLAINNAKTVLWTFDDGDGETFCKRFLHGTESTTESSDLLGKCERQGEKMVCGCRASPCHSEAIMTWLKTSPFFTSAPADKDAVCLPRKAAAIVNHRKLSVGEEFYSNTIPVVSDREWEKLKKIRIDNDADLATLFLDEHDTLHPSEYFNPIKQSELYETSNFVLLLLLTMYLILCGTIMFRILQYSGTVMMTTALEHD